MPLIVYFSSSSENTHRFVEKLGCPSLRLPLTRTQPAPQVEEPYVLITPTYGFGLGPGIVPQPVIKFLNEPANREHMVGVIGAGNTNFGKSYGLAGDVVAHKCGRPLLYKFELLGTPDDVEKVRDGMEQLWLKQAS